MTRHGVTWAAMAAFMVPVICQDLWVTSEPLVPSCRRFWGAFQSCQPTEPRVLYLPQRQFDMWTIRGGASDPPSKANSMSLENDPLDDDRDMSQEYSYDEEEEDSFAEASRLASIEEEMDENDDGEEVEWLDSDDSLTTVPASRQGSDALWNDSTEREQPARMHANEFHIDDLDNTDNAVADIHIEMSGAEDGDTGVEPEPTEATHSTVKDRDDPSDDDPEDDNRLDTKSASFTTQVLLDNPSMDEYDSASYVDRMDLADAYDDEDNEPLVPAGIEVDVDPRPTLPSAVETDDTTTEATSTEAAPVAATPEATAASRVESSTPPTEIDDATRETLSKDLMYRRAEIDGMKPEVALLVAANKLHRPAEGIPTNWRNVTSPGPWTRFSFLRPHSVKQVLPKLVGAIVVGSLALTKGPELASVFWAVVGSRHASVPPTSWTNDATLAVATGTVAASSDESIEETESNVLSPEWMDASATTQSVKPGARPAVTSALDVTWLDKLITAVERRIKALLQFEI